MEKLRRSVLFVPASNARALEKARALPADVIVLDLEDSVAPEAKDAARAAALAALGQFGGRETVVRVNALSSPWGRADLDALARARPDAILLPKVSSADALKQAGCGLPLWAMIETAAAVLNLAAIAAAGPQALVVGANDLQKEMHARPMPRRENLWAVLTQTVLAARAYGLDVIDATFNAIGDDKGFAGECEQGRQFGFDGKTVIHPSQIETANRCFSPTAQELAEARAILAAFAAPENRGRAAIALNGRMVERLHAEAAARLLARAETIAARTPC